MNWLRQNWVLYLPITGVLLVVTVLMFTVVLKSRYPEVVVENQKIVGGKVIVEKAFLTSDGFVAIHPSDATGNLVRSRSIGHRQLESGLKFNIEVELLQSVPTGTKLFAVIHRDTGALQHFEFHQGAATKDPIELVRGEPVAVQFRVN